MTSYTKLSLFRSQVNLLNELKFVTSSLSQPIGIKIPCKGILATTVHQLIEFDESLQNASYSINVTLVDGLDGSESHQIYINSYKTIQIFQTNLSYNFVSE